MCFIIRIIFLIGVELILGGENFGKMLLNIVDEYS